MTDRRELGWNDAKYGEVPLFENDPIYMDGYNSFKDSNPKTEGDFIPDEMVF